MSQDSWSFATWPGWKKKNVLTSDIILSGCMFHSKMVPCTASNEVDAIKSQLERASHLDFHLTQFYWQLWPVNRSKTPNCWAGTPNSYLKKQRNITWIFARPSHINGVIFSLSRALRHGRLLTSHTASKRKNLKKPFGASGNSQVHHSTNSFISRIKPGQCVKKSANSRISHSNCRLPHITLNAFPQNCYSWLSDPFCSLTNRVEGLLG